MEKTVTLWAFGSYLKYVWKENKTLYLLGIFFFPACILANYLEVYLPKMIILELEERQTILYLGISVLALVLALVFCVLVRETMLSQVRYGNRQIVQKMQNDYTNKLLYVDYGCLEDKKFISIRNMVKESLFGGQIGEAQERAKLMEFMETLLMILAATGNVVIYFFYLGKLSWWLIVFLLTDCCLCTVINMKIFRRNEARYGQQGGDSWQKLDYLTRKTEDFTMAKDVRLYQMADWLSGRIDGFLSERLFYKRKELTSRGIGDAVFTLSLGAYTVAVYGVVLYHFWNGDMGVSDVVFYANMAPVLYKLLDHDVSVRSMQLFRIITEFQRFRRFMDYGEDTGRLDVRIRKSAPVITLEHVSFSYPEAEKEVLKDIDLTVRAGEKVAIVGVNGAGKTTLMKLICGLLHPISGRILLNGVDMETMEAEERYAWFSCTFQDIQFLPISLRENISQEIHQQEFLENPSDYRGGDGDGKIWRCLDQAGIKKEVEGLPNKLDTLLEKSINEDATDFSGGQRQKLILARALYRDAGALILDEPTAALDALAENELYEKYAEFSQGKTSFFVSHRLSSTRFCDRILLLDGGRIAEEGTHEELLAKKGIYATMFAMQGKYYQGGEGR